MPEQRTNGRVGQIFDGFAYREGPSDLFGQEEAIGVEAEAGHVGLHADFHTGGHGSGHGGEGRSPARGLVLRP
jgi:hypothetical protein